VPIKGFVYILNPEDKAWVHEDEVIEELMMNIKKNYFEEKKLLKIL